MDVRLSAEGEHLRLNAPKGVLNENLRAQIAERKQELLEFLRTNNGSSKFLPPPIVPRKTGKAAPLSFAQERLWFLEQLEPQSAVYNICRAVRIGGNLNVAALEASLNEIVHRHETLRTALRLVDGQAVQVVQPVENLAIDVVDLRSLTESERDTEIKRLIKTEAEHPFDLHKGSLLRCKLLHIHYTEQILILITHHAASDAWSMGILTRELWKLYQAFSSDKPPPLDPLPVQYSDYAVWQREWLQGEVLQSQLSYWKKQAKELPILNLPTDRPRKPRQSFSGARLALAFTEELTRAVNELSHRHGVTPFMTLLAAFQVLLYRYSGQEDFALGSPIANRKRTEIEGLIGFFVNTLVLRADLSGNPSFTEVLSRVKNTCIGADANQDLPFEKLVQEIQPERDQSRNTLFQVMFVLQNATRPFSGIPGLRIEPVEIEATRSPFDLSLFLREREGKYIGHIEYSTDLFNRDRIERMGGHFQTLLQGIVADPNQSIVALPILTGAERHRILVEWNDTTTDYPKDKCIHQLFEDQVERTPEAIALEFDDQQITYRELNRRANQLAHYLIGLGVEAEKRVGIRVERSIEMVVALLGILKAGGAYVPLDPAYPQERLRFMLEDAQVSVLLTKQKVPEERGWPVLSEVKEIDDRAAPEIANGGYSGIENRYPPSSIPSGILRTSLGPRFKVVCLERDWPLIAQQRDDNPNQAVNSDNLSYVIYTSGSTGTPKGVAIEHRNTVNLLYWAKSTYGPSDLAGVLASTSICFDLSVFEIFVPLSWGGKIILVENALSLRERPDPGITLVNTVPSVITQVLALGRLPASVQVVNLAGERLNVDLVNRLYEEPSVQRVHDLYGPSETTTYSTFTLRTKEGPTTIGQPVANTQVFILDSSFQLIPVGVQGELYIGGDGVARGYLNQPELTSERFVPHPFSDNPAKRIYRTGDRARYRPDGTIEFLGRTDNQVKIRGYRIELGEIESALNQHPAIKESVVVARDRDSNLIGYFVSKEPSSIAISGLRHFLRKTLPEYMVPSLFMELDVLPKTPNGKIDRIALRSSEHTRTEPKKTHIEPRSQVEELLAQIWGEVLHIEGVGIYENFFELGGHSLLAVQIISQVRDALDKDVPLSALFDTPTVAGLAATIQKTIGASSHDLPPILRAPHDGALPLSLNQEHLWKLEQMIPNNHFFNMPFVYYFKGELKIEVLARTIQEIIRRHEALRSVFTTVDGSPVQMLSSIATCPLLVMDLRGHEPGNLEQQTADLILGERRLPFDLAVGPPLRIKLLRLIDNGYLLLITMHHIASDQWSMRIFRRELAILYDSFALERSSPLPSPVIQFVDFACWERQSLESPLMKGQLAYWKKQLSRPLPELEFQKTIEGKITFGNYRHFFEVDEDLLSNTKSIARSENCTSFMVLLAVLSVTLFVYTGQTDIRIATLAANRRRKVTELTIGHFVNTLILRIRFSPRMGFTELLRHVREVALEAYAHQEFPFEQLARVLEQEQDLDRGSLSQVLVIHQTANVQPLPLPGPTFASLTKRHIAAGTNITITSFDLVFDLIEESNKLTGSVTFKADSLDDQFIVDMIDCFRRILRIIGRGDLPVSVAAAT